MNLEQRITQAWYQKRRWIYLFTPLELVYRGIVAIRKRLYKHGLFKHAHPGIAVVVVGNLTVGGTGKTPVVIEIVNYLKNKGWNPGVISRGYGGSNKNYPYLVDAKSSAENCGDEPVLIYRNTNVNVVIDKDRLRASKLLKAQGCDIVVSDDGLQHLALERDFELLLIDGKRGFGNQRLLPVGPLREPVSRVVECDFVLTNGVDNRCVDHLNSDCFPITADYLCDIETKKQFPLSWLENKEIHALAGIGNPNRFFDLLKQLGSKPICHPYPDHHDYQMSDIPNDKKSIVVTEKDAVKLEKFNLLDCLMLKISAELPQNFYHKFDSFLENISNKYKQV